MNIEIFKHLFATVNPTICHFAESNSKEEDKLAELFPDYDIIHNKENNHPLDRIIALMKKDKVDYKHMDKINDSNIPSIWIRI